MIGVNSLIPSPFQQNPFARAPIVSFGRGCGCGGSFAGGCRCGELGDSDFGGTARLERRLARARARVRAYRAAIARAVPGSRQQKKAQRKLWRWERVLARLEGRAAKRGLTDEGGDETEETELEAETETEEGGDELGDAFGGPRLEKRLAQARARIRVYRVAIARAAPGSRQRKAAQRKLWRWERVLARLEGRAAKRGMTDDAGDETEETETETETGIETGELGAPFPVAALGQRIQQQRGRVATLRAAMLRAKPGSRQRHQLERRLRHAERTLSRLTTLWHNARIGNRTRRYGADTPAAAAPAAATSDDTTLYATAAGAALKKLTEGSADESVEVLQAKIRNQAALAKSVPEPLATYYRNNVRVMKAKLKAAKRAKVEEQATTQTKREFFQLGQAGIVTGILIGGATILYLLTRSTR